jgi:hypothetical protein
MKRFSKIALMLIVFALIVLQGWTDHDAYYYYDYYAVYMDRAYLEKSVSYSETPRDLKNPGKIYYKHPYLFINEKYKGVHIIDNTNPLTPVNKGFITAPGCLDMAVKDDIIYLDNAVDMVSFDLHGMNPSGMKVTKRIPDIFPEPVPPSANVRYDDRREGFIVVEWVKVEKIKNTK